MQKHYTTTRNTTKTILETRIRQTQWEIKVFKQKLNTKHIKTIQTKHSTIHPQYENTHTRLTKKTQYSNTKYESMQPHYTKKPHCLKKRAIE